MQCADLKEEEDDDNDDDAIDDESARWTLPAGTNLERAVLNRSSNSARDITDADNIFAAKVKQELKYPIIEDDFLTKNDYRREVVAAAETMVSKAVNENVEKVLKNLTESERNAAVKAFPIYASIVEQINNSMKIELPSGAGHINRRGASPIAINPAAVRILPPAPSKYQKKSISLYQRMENLRKPITKPYRDCDVYLWRAGGAIESVGTNTEPPIIRHYVMNNSQNASDNQPSCSGDRRAAHAPLGNVFGSANSRHNPPSTDITASTSSSSSSRVGGAPVASNAVSNRLSASRTPRGVTRPFSDDDGSSSRSTSAEATAAVNSLASTETSVVLAPQAPPLVRGEALPSTDYSLPRARDVVFSSAAILDATRTTMSGRNLLNTATVDESDSSTAVGVVAEATPVPVTPAASVTSRAAPSVTTRAASSNRPIYAHVVGYVPSGSDNSVVISTPRQTRPQSSRSGNTR